MRLPVVETFGRNRQRQVLATLAVVGRDGPHVSRQVDRLVGLALLEHQQHGVAGGVGGEALVLEMRFEPEHAREEVPSLLHVGRVENAFDDAAQRWGVVW